MAAVASSSNPFQSSLFLAHSESFAPAQRPAFHSRAASAPVNEQTSYSHILRQPRGPPSGSAAAHTSSWRQRVRPAELPLSEEPSTTPEAPASPGKSPKSPKSPKSAKSPKRRGGRRSATPRSASPSVSEGSWRSRSSSPAPFKAARPPLPVVETAPASAAPVAEGSRVYSLVDLLALSVSPLVGVSAKDEAHMEDLVFHHTWRRGPQGTSSRSSSRSPSPSPSHSSSRASSPARRTLEGRRRAPSPSKLRESILNAEDSD